MHAIAALDLEPIKVKLMHQQSGEGWPLERVNAIALEYRRFLTLMKKFPNEETSPLVDVDTFWHYHILDTMKYAADCQAVFGYFLHHFPYLGMRGEDDAAALARVGYRMKQLYEEEFGIAYGSAVADTAAAYCGSTTAPQRNAYCGATAAAYCGSTTGNAGQNAYCGSATVNAGKTAYCGSATVNASKTAYCGSTTVSTNKAAYCGSATAAYCGSTTAPQTSSLYTARPRLS